MMTPNGPLIARRTALLGLTAAVSLGRASLAVAAAPGDRRFIVVNMRGAMDGLAVVVPYGDPALPDLRGPLLPPAPGQPDGLLDLGGYFGLHPALAAMHAMYQANELLPVHAVAGPYRIRSHFDAQDFLESGADHRMTSGWLNRVVAAMPHAAVNKPEGDALAIGVSVPLLLRGTATVSNWAPHGFATPAPDLYTAVAALNQPDPLIGPALAEGVRARDFSQAVMTGHEPETRRYAFPALAKAAGEMLAAPDGPRIAAIEIDGWDTHVNQIGLMHRPLMNLDAGMDALKTALGPAWANTVVLTMTEFGRTARVNGTKGTDHGTGTVAFVLGGAVSGGRVQATWPGLGTGKLFEDRDLAPTLDLRSVAKGLLSQHLGLHGAALAAVFPDSTPAEPLRGLLRA
jgi:uncharacterized protein (DUF1501 family)